MFIRWFSTTFVKTVWRFFDLTAVNMQKTAISYKKNHFFLIFLRNTLDTRFKLSRNVYQMIIYNFSIDTMLRKSRFLDLTAVNMQKNVFLAIFWIYTLSNSIPLQLSNSLLRQISNLLTLQLISSPTHLLANSLNSRRVHF